MSADREKVRLAAVFHVAERVIGWAEAPDPQDHGRRRCRACGESLEGPPRDDGTPRGHQEACVMQDMRNALYGAVMSEDAVHEAMALAQVHAEQERRAGAPRIVVQPAPDPDKMGPMEVDQE